MRPFFRRMGKVRSWPEIVDTGSREFNANPFPFYARLRAEAPVCRIPLRTGETAWFVTRYDDAATVLKDERFIKNRSIALTAEQDASQIWFRKLLKFRWFKPLQQTMLHLDPPDHTRLRALVSKAFSPRLIETMQDRMRRLAKELLDLAQKQSQVDLIRDYALPFPITIIAELLGVPPEDRQQFQRWSRAHFVSSFWGLVNALPNALALLRYLRKISKQRRAVPRDDLISALVLAEEGGDRMSEGELLAMIALLLIAGHETTANLIGNGTLALLEHPDQLDRLRNHPELIKPAVEELLRYSGPLKSATERYTREDVSLAGITIPRGEMVAAEVASANRDERQFPEPDTLNIRREPNKHLAFGLGTHFCVGAALARLEGQIAIDALVRNFPDLRLAAAPRSVSWRPGLLLRGLDALPVVLGK